MPDCAEMVSATISVTHISPNAKRTPTRIDGNAPGLGLLPLVTVFAREKTVRHRRARFAGLQGAWAALSGVEVAGYEIHHGQTAEHPQLKGDGGAVMSDGLAWQNARGNVLGVYLHGLFEDAAVLRALFGAAVPTLDATFDGLADFIDRHFAPGEHQPRLTGLAPEPVDHSLSPVSSQSTR